MKTAATSVDGYKLGHKDQYKPKTEKVVATWTPRSDRYIPQAKLAVVLGQQYAVITYLINYWNKHFFNKPKNIVIERYKTIISNYLDIKDPETLHLEQLHDLGYLPLEVKSLPEGMRVPFRTPVTTIESTLPDFFWLTNYVETAMSSYLWKPSTSATIASIYYNTLMKYAEETGDPDFVMFQAHDFSLRGHPGLEAALMSAFGHACFFAGSDTVDVFDFVEEFYNADITNDLIIKSVNATEHAVQESYTQNDREYCKHLITNVYKTGILSIVADGYDYWNFVSKVLVDLKDDIMNRDGKLVIRGDSGDPVDIICGSLSCFAYSDDSKVKIEDYVEDLYDAGKIDLYDEAILLKTPSETIKVLYEDDVDSYTGDIYGITISKIIRDYIPTPEEKGTVECLWDTFKGTVNEKGYKVFDSHVGCIYGDAITMDRCEKICQKLKDKGFASTNVVFGVGSYTYNMNSRDTLGYALKSVHMINDGKEVNLFKDPKTDDGTKKSQRGCVAVFKDANGNIKWTDGLTLDQANNYEGNLLTTIFKDGKLVRETSFNEVRERIKNS